MISERVFRLGESMTDLTEKEYIYLFNKIYANSTESLNKYLFKNIKELI